MSAQLDIFTARTRRDVGMKRAGDHADRVSLEWRETAWQLLVMYLVGHREDFLAEQFVAWASPMIVRPPDPRAWGCVLMMARRRGTIVKVGYRPAATSNMSPKCLWRPA